MAIIPEILKEYRFIRTKEKMPIDLEWNSVNNFNYSDMNKIIIDEHRTTYGVLTGYNNLYVVDFDELELQENIINKYPIFLETFIVKSATKGLYHCYFKSKTTEPKTIIINDKNDNRIVDILAKGKQVIGANSILSTGKKYEIVSDKEIKEVDFLEIEEIFRSIKENIIEIKTKSKKIAVKTESLIKDKNYWIFPLEEKKDIELIKEKLKISYYLKYLNIIQDEKQESGNCSCPFHDSKGGKCFSYDNEKKTWNCFHCNRGGDIFSLYKLMPENKYKNFKYIVKELAELCNIELFKERKENVKKLQKEVIKEIKKEKKDENLIIYKNLNLKKIIIFKKKDESFTIFYFETFSITIDVKDLLSGNKFKELYFSETGTMLPNLAVNEWSEIISEWMEKIGEMKNDFYNDDSFSILKEKMIGVINDFIIIENKEESLGANKILYLKEYPDSIFINVQVLTSALIRNQLYNSFKNKNYNIFLIFKEDLIDNSKIIIIKNQKHRYYEFNKSIISNFKINCYTADGEVNADFGIEE